MSKTAHINSVVFGVTGGIAAYKAVEAVRLLVKRGIRVDVVMTDAAREFITPLTFSAVSGRPVLTGMFGGRSEGTISHIEMTAGADLFVVAPATANIIAKAAHGIADDLLSTMLLAARCPVLFAPAMNCRMYENRATRENLKTLKERGFLTVGPEEGPMACGESGWGRMSEPGDIVEEAGRILGLSRELSGRRVLVTAGPTFEDIDPVRFIGNRSSGKMGYALVREAVRRGGDVTLVTGPVSIDPPEGAEVVRVRSAAEMNEELRKRSEGADVIIMAAAVADYTPKAYSESKIKKKAGALDLPLKRTPDILTGLSKRRRDGQVIAGFAAETDDLEKHAAAKLKKKGLDIIAANPVGGKTGFGSEDNDLYIYGPEGLLKHTGVVSKDAAAAALLGEIIKILCISP